MCFFNRTEEKIFSFLLLGDFKENLSLLVSGRPASFCPPAKMRLVMKDNQQSSTASWIFRTNTPKVNVALLKVHVKDMELGLVQLKAHKEASTCEVS